MRHPKNCRYWSKCEEGCKRENACQYLHKNDMRFQLLIEDSCFPCDKCDYKTSIVTEFENHMKENHKEEQPTGSFACSQCEYRTKNKKQYIEHKNTAHKETVPFECNQCEYNSLKGEDFNEHMHKTHKSVIFECKECDYKSNEKSNLEQHNKNIHEKKNLLCKYCKNTATNVCFDCSKDWCLTCVKLCALKQLNQKARDKALEKGIIDKEMEPKTCICKICFRKRCADKGLIKQ